ncbi:helix-turn-helix domain-containing protein [Caulobacter sp. RHG1]|uniref:helix-turn-helix domain-containing protein n=1 Tax=Caulobacter sp. (strain RHG1) TaxID=2545762 RepID=UPI00155766EC|nr:helix-turn-helix domain-containing protein [Caulobacter sp. RHG1]NQE63655.1 hypothetical protein [Caulobacter sp. RHG1]
MGLYAMQWAFNAPIRSSGAKFILVALAEHARDEGREAWTCFPSVKRLAKWTAQGERTIERHLAWLIAEGWISREARQDRRRGESAYFYTLRRFGGEGGQEPDQPSLESPGGANLAKLKRAFGRQFGAKHPPISAPTPANMASAYIEEPVIEPVSEPNAPQAGTSEDHFAEFWSAYPNKVEQRGAKVAFMRLVRCGDATPDELIRGARGYAQRVQDRPRRFTKSPTSWLLKGCWADEAAPPPSAQLPAGSQAFEGPSEIWAGAIRTKDLGWATSYLAPCAWIPSSRTIRTRTALAARALRDELGALLRDLSVTIVDPANAFGATHAR